MTNDLANSKGRRIIQELGGEDRTIAVLTKADLAQPDAQQQYISKLRGDSLFGHGLHSCDDGSGSKPEA